jgi:hypothetical protein
MQIVAQIDKIKLWHGYGLTGVDHKTPLLYCLTAVTIQDFLLVFNI